MPCLHTANIALGESPFPELLDQESGFDLYERDSDIPVTPPDQEAREGEVEEEMEVDIEAGTDAPTSSETAAQLQDEPDTKSSSHSPSFHSSSTIDSISKQPKFESAPAIKHDPVAVATVGLREPPDNDPTKLYCLCQEPATFSMIPCHKCQNWFHGECVGLTRQKAATVKQFFCPLCIDKDPSLVTTFESRAEREAAMLKKERGAGSSHGKGYKKSGKKHSRR